MEPNVATDRDHELWVLLCQTCDIICRAREDELRPFGISHIQAGVLFVVKNVKAPVTPADISRWLFREPHTVSGLLNRMERNGLVRRRSDAKNKKQRRVVMTKKGKELFRLAQEQNALHTIMGSMSDEGFEQLWTLLEELKATALSLTEKLKDAVPSPA